MSLQAGGAQQNGQSQILEHHYAAEIEPGMSKEIFFASITCLM